MMYHNLLLFSRLRIMHIVVGNYRAEPEQTPYTGSCQREVGLATGWADGGTDATGLAVERSCCHRSASSKRLRAASPAIPNGIAGEPPAGLMACTSVKTPLGVIWTIILMGGSVKYRLPSGPAVIACGWALAVGTVNSVITPLVVTRPMMLSNLLTNHRLPSGPVVMSLGSFGPVTG